MGRHPDLELLDEALVNINADVRAQRLNEVFGGLRAEYFRAEIFELFARPAYWPELLTRRPCLLVGGRGTGKTTALRGLSYQGLSHLASSNIEEWGHVGLYWRVDTNTVRAFRGGSLTEDEWIRIFAHYVNMVLVQLAVEFLVWVRDSTGKPIDLDATELDRCCRALMIEPVGGDLQQLVSVLEDAVVDFETAVNNIDARDQLRLSVLGRPVTHMARALQHDKRIDKKPLFFLVDEYENLDDYQQRVFNTLIKHAGDEAYTFKVGMKATGHRERSTLNPDEFLVDPADYAVIDIADRLKAQGFAEFAREVCTGRLDRVSDDLGHSGSIEDLFPYLSEEAESELLGVDARTTALRMRLNSAGASDAELAAFDGMSPLSAYMIEYWARSQAAPELTVLRDALSEPSKWSNRMGNYQHAALYTIRRGRRGIRKYYAGWDTYVHMADGNIRYLLQLVHEALQEHLTDQRSLSSPVSPVDQTVAAQAVGGRLVEQLQGLSAQGADLTRLVLGLGRIFQVMALNPEGHTPEVSQFRVRASRAEQFDVFTEDLLNAGVMHLAVRRFPGDKMAGASGETREYNYQLHPIFAPFFVFSYRSKRRMDIGSEEIYGLVREPRVTIERVLAKSKRDVPEDLPEQMSLFEGYFG